MASAARLVSQALAYAAFAALVGYFSLWPRYEYASPDAATVKVSLRHATARVEPCVRLTPEEIAALPPNMRRPELCKRERVPLWLELDVDGQSRLRVQALPSGAWSDGPASIYERFDLPPGLHHISVRLRDSARAEGWDYTHSQDAELESGRYLTITFKAESGGFRFR